MSKSTTTGLGRLGRLPGELRNDIYERALTDDNIKLIAHQAKDGSLRFCHHPESAVSSEQGLVTFKSLSLVSSALAAETRPIFFKVNTFHISFQKLSSEPEKCTVRFNGLEYKVRKHNRAADFATACLPHITSVLIQDMYSRSGAIRATMVVKGEWEVEFLVESISTRYSSQSKIVEMQMGRDARMDEEQLTKLWARLKAELRAQ